MFKKCKVVLLPTNKATLGGLCKQVSSSINLRDKDINKIFKVVNDFWVQNYNNGSTDPMILDFVPVHLYIISDEEIKEGDWGFINIGKNGIIGKISRDVENNTWDLTTKDNIHYPFSNKSYIKKIIAPTDNSLNIKVDRRIINEEERDIFQQLPSPSQSFIDKYISEYNKGNIIEDIMVEYEFDKPFMSLNEDNERVENYPIQLKVSKDNTITIKRVKDSWSREEVRQLCWEAYTAKEPKQAPKSIEPLIKEFNTWIEENL